MAHKKTQQLTEYAFRLFCEPLRFKEVPEDDEDRDYRSLIKENYPLPFSSPKAEQIQQAAIDFYSINRDTEDDEYIENAIQNLESIYPFFNPKNPAEQKIRKKILERLWDFDEHTRPSDPSRRFGYLQRMVHDIKNNQGEFDHDPLFSSARRISYFMKEIPARKRLALLMEIDRKTINHARYDYTDQLAAIKQDYDKEKQSLAEEKIYDNQFRYDEIRSNILPQEKDPKERIKLYKELMHLIKDQDWSRKRKFQEKKTICNHLIKLYNQIGDIELADRMKDEKEKFIRASQIAETAARRKGYHNR